MKTSFKKIWKQGCYDSRTESQDPDNKFMLLKNNITIVWSTYEEGKMYYVQINSPCKNTFLRCLNFDKKSNVFYSSTSIHRITQTNSPHYLNEMPIEFQNIILDILK
jgi:hypothetical protein